MTNSKTQYKLTEKDFNQINKRSLFAFQLGWNYERMQNSGYLYTILPQLRKIYGDGTPELKEMMKEHAAAGNSVLFSTHVLEVAEKLCDQIAIINRGVLMYLGTLDDLRARYPEQSLEDIFLEITEHA